MNKKTIILIIIGFILTILITIGITLAVAKNKETKKLNRINVSENKSKKEESSEVEDPEIKVEEETAKNKENNTSQKNYVENKSSNKNNGTQTTEPVIPTEVLEEADVINYVENISLESTGNKLKTGFVTVIDFLFYGGEIYDKTFSELSYSAKIKIIALALKIDSKIDEYFPGYKESISTTTNKVYTNIKTKLVTLYLDITVKICNNNPTLCEDAKQGLTELKQDFGLTWDFIKDVSGVGFSKLKDWYEVWREE